MKKFALLALLAVAGGANAQLSVSAESTAFTDISTSGTSIGAISDDSETIIGAASIAGYGGNALLAAGRDIMIGNNGCILWGASAGDAFTNANQIGYTNASLVGLVAANLTNTGNGGLGPRQFLAVNWDDHLPAAAGGTGIFYQVIGGNLIVQWNNEDLFAASGTGVGTWEAIIYAGLGPNGQYMDYVFNDTDYGAGAAANDGASSTFGFKDWVGGGLNDAQWAFNTSSVTGWVASGGGTGPHAIKFTPVPEPGTFIALGLGALGLAAARRRKK